MSSKNTGNVSSSSSTGIGTSGALLVAFVVLKLCGVIDWSWWWVTAPAWMPISLLAVGAGLFFGGWYLLERYQGWRRKRRGPRKPLGA